MSNNAVAKRYATALFELANEQNLLELIQGELREIKKSIKDNPELINLLKLPKLSSDKKKQVIKEIFQSSSPLVVNTLMLLSDRHRVDEITSVADEFIELANSNRGIAEATVYSIRPLTASESAAISSVFAQKVGRVSLNIENIIDTELLGGVKIRIGNKIFDGSLRGKLDRLERSLIS
ncbi:F0F1 ATP synthase subunit delta [Bacillus obstructivus]|jgi:F-type H+-transporting ATPase subunit delta|uniref:ATP synthase subunit delta n=1 Tax=Heyndrickxia oleronia TaxID=38875 RepID=A0AAW6T0L4_9BACI|nr:F0F1 ATP synthase subunit delta [Heyndrickxia oleronia]MCM3239883.1 F0F1 ATP synthase subunit delta [Heyndrickxia oleronia]MDH5162809.1 F0F1 ATP synthase subunit delta [Heyndrickxia oleronia]OJH16526.1 F0F1 ATP synthase subunit delta [Bacillus obstructivus]